MKVVGTLEDLLEEETKLCIISMTEVRGTEGAILRFIACLPIVPFQTHQVHTMKAVLLVDEVPWTALPIFLM